MLNLRMHPAESRDDTEGPAELPGSERGETRHDRSKRKVDMSRNRITRRQFSGGVCASAAAAALFPAGALATELSQPAGPLHPSVRRRRGRRHHRAARRREARRQARPALRGREPARARRHCGGAFRALAAARRLHDRPRHQRHRDQRRDLQGAAVRSGQGVRAVSIDRQFRPGVRDQCGFASSRRCRTSSRRRASSPASSMSAPSRSAARRISGPSCSSPRPAWISRSFPTAARPTSSLRCCATTSSS